VAPPPIPGTRGSTGAHSPGTLSSFRRANGGRSCFAQTRQPRYDGDSDRARYLESLELIRGLEFDLLVPDLATAGQSFYELVDRGEVEPRIDAIIERLRRGEDG
jgi:hypothetical protein